MRYIYTLFKVPKKFKTIRAKNGQDMAIWSAIVGCSLDFLGPLESTSEDPEDECILLFWSKFITLMKIDHFDDNSEL